MTSAQDHLALDIDALLGQCDVQTYKASGPGGQHRNKVTSAVRLRHGPTGVTAQAEDSRSQHENKQLAVKRLRMKIACQVRGEVDAGELKVIPVVAECIHAVRGQGKARKRRLEVGRRDHRFWQVAAFVLDLLDAHHGRLAETGSVMGISTSNLASWLKSDRHLLAAAQGIRKRNGLKGLS